MTGSSRNSLLLLVLANTVPIVGVAQYNWDLKTLLVLFWAEAAIIGLYHVIRLLLGARFQGLLLSLGFITSVLVGMFIHAVIIATLFFPYGDGTTKADITTFLSILETMKPAVLALFVSHGFSFIYNGMYLGEYKQVSRNKIAEMFKKPFWRIAPVQLTALIVAVAVGIIGEQMLLLVAFIAIKGVVDVRAHVRFHDVYSKSVKKDFSEKGSPKQKEIVVPRKGPQYVDYTKHQNKVGA